MNIRLVKQSRIFKCKDCGESQEHFTSYNTIVKKFCDRCLRRENTERNKIRTRLLAQSKRHG